MSDRSYHPGSLRSFSYCSSVYSCHLFLISSASVSPIPFLSFIVPIFAWNAFLICLSLLFSAICKTSSDNHFAFLNSFYWGWLWSLPPVKCSDKIWCTGGGNGKQFQHSSLRTPWMYFHCYNISNFCLVVTYDSNKIYPNFICIVYFFILHSYNLEIKSCIKISLTSEELEICTYKCLCKPLLLFNC